MGIEPTSEAWEASILPLYDARSATNYLQDSIAGTARATAGSAAFVSQRHDVAIPTSDERIGGLRSLCEAPKGVPQRLNILRRKSPECLQGLKPLMKRQALCRS